MLSKRLAIAATTIALGLGTLGVGASPALAADSGVGPSEGTTGQAQACRAHALNEGKSLGEGLDCTPAPAQASFTVKVVPYPDLPQVCSFIFVGTGLASGGTITYVHYGTTYELDFVAADGTFMSSDNTAINNGDIYIITAPTASGGTISVTATSLC